MKIAIGAESDPSEPRVAATPETVKKLVGLGAEVAIEPGAGLKYGILDADYAGAGAAVGPGGNGPALHTPCVALEAVGNFTRLRSRGRLIVFGKCFLIFVIFKLVNIPATNLVSVYILLRILRHNPSC